MDGPSLRPKVGACCGSYRARVETGSARVARPGSSGDPSQPVLVPIGLSAARSLRVPTRKGSVLDKVPRYWSERSRHDGLSGAETVIPRVVALGDAEATMVQPHDPLGGSAAEARRFFQERLRLGVQAVLGEMSGQPLTREQARLAEQLQRTLQRVSAEGA